MKIEIGSEEWLEFRRNKIMATDAPVIMGVSPWTTPLQLYKKKKERVESATNTYMKRGLELEPIARDLFEEKMGIFVWPEVRVSEEFDWMGATFDGINDDGIVVEIKCPGHKDHDLAIEGNIPEKYFPQCQHQMMVADVSSMYYVSYNPESETPLVILNVSRDDLYCETLKEKELEFLSCLKEDREPEKSSRDVDYEMINDETLLKEEEMLACLIKKKKEIEDQIDLLKEKITSSLNGTRAKGMFLCFSMTERKGQVEYSKIPELKDVDVEKYRKPSCTVWSVKEY